MKEGMIGSCAVIILWTVIMPYVIAATMGTSILLRGSLTLLSLFPLGLLMGIPFATGIRYLSNGQQRFIPWAWGNQRHDQRQCVDSRHSPGHAGGL